MPKQVIQPTCKYGGHGPMRLIKEIAPGDSNTGAVFGLHAIVRGQPLPRIDMGRTFMVHVYECATCTYLEFHDFDL